LAEKVGLFGTKSSRPPMTMMSLLGR